MAYRTHSLPHTQGVVTLGRPPARREDGRLVFGIVMSTFMALAFALKGAFFSASPFLLLLGLQASLAYVTRPGAGRPSTCSVEVGADGSVRVVGGDRPGIVPSGELAIDVRYDRWLYIDRSRSIYIDLALCDRESVDALLALLEGVAEKKLRFPAGGSIRG